MSTTNTHILSYDYQELATVTINKTPETDLLIKEMVEFWMNWERELRQHDGDYTRCWLMKLAMHILRHGHAPRDEEGWFPLDGSQGIHVEHVFQFEFDPDEIQIDSEEHP
jgi:hypothetical protein